ncbi:MAG: tRNA lysidine(34) synthetase TilS [Oceanipulchritudo sp.]
MPSWKEIHRRFDALRPVRWVHPGVLAFLESLPSGKPLLVASSGGADSVFLTLVMHSLSPGSSLRLRICHFNHHLRGAASDEDEAFVREMGRELDLPFESGFPESPLSADEAALRKARYRWLLEVYRRTGAAAMVLGQHADDLLESLLMGLLTGSGPAGLAAPAPVRRFADGHVRLRPLLDLQRGRIERSLRELGIPWREDATNADTRYTRNWLRADIIPQLRARFPQDIHAAVRRTRNLMEECVAALDARLGELEFDPADPLELDLGNLAGGPAALTRRALMAWWLSHRPATRLPTAAVDELVKAVCEGRDATVSIGSLCGGESETEGRQVLSLAAGRLEVTRESNPSPVRWACGIHWHWPAGPVYLPGGAFLRGELKEWPPLANPPYRDADARGEAWLGPVEGPLLVRPWQAGDRYRPLVAPGQRKLQDLFVDAKIPAEQKHRLPVILDAGRSIVWVPGFPPAEAFKVCHPAISALQLTYNRQ